MEIQVQRGCGLDVHQATVVACLLTVLASGKVKKEIRKFGTTTRDLVALREWLQVEGCIHVAMESTGVYWIAVYDILEYRDEKRTRRTASGLPTCCCTACSSPALCLPSPSANCAT